MEVSTQDELYPLALLMDELKHDDLQNRVEAMQKLDTIALALGPERTRNELIPFLQEVAQDDEDEVFSVLAEQLGKFVPFVGGHQYCSGLIQILQILSSMEEPAVRDKAIDSLNEISKSLTDEEVHVEFLDLIERLSNGNWFSSKVASCGLYKSVILRVDAEIRRNLLNLYLKLVQDDAPMVRRSAATNLPQLVNKLQELATNTDETKKNEVDTADWKIISSMFQSLINDEQDSVKFLSVDVLISILEFFKAMNDPSHNSEFLVSALKLVNDESWRVRYMAADRFAKISVNFADDESDINSLIPQFIALMKDNEGEVRKAISKQLPEFAKLIPKEAILNEIIPIVDELSHDPQENVRSALASEVTGLAPYLGKDATIDNLLPIFLSMLKDEFPDVRLNIISKLTVVNDVIGISLLSKSLLPAITELAKDKQWRVRLAIIEYIPLLAEQLGVSFFDEELGALCMSWLWDSVYSIREAAVGNLEKLTAIFGSTWAKEEIISRLLAISKSEDSNIDYANFVIRITCLFALTKLISVVSKELIISDILPLINDLSKDSVPNIKFNVAKSYLTIVENLIKTNTSEDAEDSISEAKVSEIISSEILPNLQALQNDSDVDVRFFSSKSLHSVNDIIKV